MAPAGPLPGPAGRAVCTGSARGKGAVCPCPDGWTPPTCPRTTRARCCARAHAAGALDLPLPGAGRTLARWTALAELSAADLVLGRLAEAHADAVAILAELGGPAAGRAAGASGPPSRRTRGSQAGRTGDGWVLDGRKAWCSGALVLDAALVTAHADDGRRLFAVDVARRAPGAGHLGRRRAWPPAARSRSTSTACAPRPVGGPGAYLDRPGFWHGGAGVAACWYGGALGAARVLLAAARAPDARPARPRPPRGGRRARRRARGPPARSPRAEVDADPRRRRARSSGPCGCGPRVEAGAHGGARPGRPGARGRPAVPRPRARPPRRRPAGLPAPVARRARPRRASARSPPTGAAGDPRSTAATAPRGASGSPLLARLDLPRARPRRPPGGRSSSRRTPTTRCSPSAGCSPCSPPRGTPVQVLAVTDGEASNPGGTRAPGGARRRGGCRRRDAALAALGVRRRGRAGSGLPDGGGGGARGAGPRRRSTWRRGPGCSARGRGDGHPDHEAVGRACRAGGRARRRAAARLPGLGLALGAPPDDPRVPWARAPRVDLPEQVRVRPSAARSTRSRRRSAPPARCPRTPRCCRRPSSPGSTAAVETVLA